MTAALLPANLVRRRAVRFWQSWVGMLAGTLPVWIVPLLVAMAFPVMKPGNLILFKNGLPVFGACTCCTGGTPGVACVNCSSTPLTWTVTFADVENASPCHQSPNGFRGSRQAGTGTLDGTYTLTQDAGNSCVWTLQTHGPSLDFYDEIFPPCVTHNTTRDDLNINLQKDASTDVLIQAFQGLAGDTPFANGQWFDGSVTTASLACCTPTASASNTQTTYSTSAVGINGTAVATPNC